MTNGLDFSSTILYFFAFLSEPQVRSICNHVRPDRQTLLFSATFKKRVEKLARDVLTDPVRIVQGDVGEANTDVTQHVVMFHSNPSAKWSWLLHHIVEFLSAGSLLIFVTKKVIETTSSYQFLFTNCLEADSHRLFIFFIQLNAEEVSNNLRLKEFDVLLLHGDMDQTERNKVITSFKKQEVSILVATDVAGEFCSAVYYFSI